MSFSSVCCLRAFAALVVICALHALSASASAQQLSLDEARSLVATYCLDCHGAEEPEAGLDLAQFDTVEAVQNGHEMWDKVLERVQVGEMPPEGAEPLPLADREKLIAWIEETLRAGACGDGADPGPTPLRRLYRTEYRTTIRDLLGIHFNAGHSLPADGAGGEGFDNAAETLFLSPVHFEKYLEAAQEALDYAAKDSRAREIIFVARPNEETSFSEAAREVLQHFAARAFRRPVTEEELAPLVKLAEQAQERGEPFEAAVFYALEAVLVSPHFLFRLEQDPIASEPQPVSDYELATRLSYFLWSSMPDKRLFELAAEGKLHDPETLREQTRRMLDDDKSRGLAENFIGQWLGTRDLGGSFKPDEKLFPRFDDEMASAMREEPVLLFRHMLEKNRSLLELIDADYTYVNNQLARHYGIRDEIERELQQRPVRVDLPEGTPRGGVLTMGGVLAISSFPHRTSPVLRGKWVLETLLGSSPPPPPPDAGELAEDEESVKGKTLRERLAAHRADATCAACHDRLDPIGFALENFDAVGRWRTKDAGQAIDASGELPGGARFDGPEGLKQVLLERKEQFVRQLTEKMLGYALGRGLVNEDRCTVEQIVERLKKNDYRAQELILGVVESVPFRYRRGMPAATGGQQPDEQDSASAELTGPETTKTEEES